MSRLDKQIRPCPNYIFVLNFDGPGPALARQNNKKKSNMDMSKFRCLNLDMSRVDLPNRIFATKPCCDLIRRCELMLFIRSCWLSRLVLKCLCWISLCPLSLRHASQPVFVDMCNHCTTSTSIHINNTCENLVVLYVNIHVHSSIHTYCWCLLCVISCSWALVYVWYVPPLGFGHVLKRKQLCRLTFN
jgi:hypothetical protein